MPLSRLALTTALAELGVMKATISWRVTRPLRAVRARQLGASIAGSARREVSTPQQPNSRHETALDRDEHLAFVRRLVQATEILLPNMGFDSPSTVEEALDAFEEAATSSTAPDRAKAWLSLVAVDGTYPGEERVERMARVLRMDGGRAFEERCSRASCTASSKG